jgi:hypothetical protein
MVEAKSPVFADHSCRKLDAANWRSGEGFANPSARSAHARAFAPRLSATKARGGRDSQGFESFRLAQADSGGEGGIRTPDTVARMPHFECGAFNHSATSPDDATGLSGGAVSSGLLGARQGRGHCRRGSAALAGSGPGGANLACSSREMAHQPTRDRIALSRVVMGHGGLIRIGGASAEGAGVTTAHGP